MSESKKTLLMKGDAQTPRRFWSYALVPEHKLKTFFENGWVRCHFDVANPAIVKD